MPSANSKSANAHPQPATVINAALPLHVPTEMHQYSHRCDQQELPLRILPPSLLMALHLKFCSVLHIPTVPLKKKVLHRPKFLLIYPVRSLLFPITCMIMLFSFLLKSSGWTSPPFCSTGFFNAPSVSDLRRLGFVVFSVIYCSLGFVSLFWLVLLFFLFSYDE